MAHEMGHVKNYDIRVSLIVFGLVIAIGLIADIIFRLIFWGGRSRNSNLGGPAFLIVIAIGLVAAILAPIVAAVVQAAVSRQREYLADATSSLTTRNPEALASALEKLGANAPAGGPHQHEHVAPVDRRPEPPRLPGAHVQHAPADRRPRRPPARQRDQVLGASAGAAGSSRLPRVRRDVGADRDQRVLDREAAGDAAARDRDLDPGSAEHDIQSRRVDVLVHRRSRRPAPRRRRASARRLRSPPWRPSRPPAPRRRRAAPGCRRCPSRRSRAPSGSPTRRSRASPRSAQARELVGLEVDREAEAERRRRRGRRW